MSGVGTIDKCIKGSNPKQTIDQEVHKLALPQFSDIENRIKLLQTSKY